MGKGLLIWVVDEKISIPFKFCLTILFCSIGLICDAFRRTYFFWRKKSKQKNIDKINSLARP